MANSLLLCKAWQNSRKSLVYRAIVSCVHRDLLPAWNSHSPSLIRQHTALESTGCKCQPFSKGLEGIPRILAKIEDVPNSWLLVISPTEKELSAGSNCCGKQRHGEIVKVKLSKIASLIDKKACSAFQNTEQGPISRKSLIINGPGKLPPFTLKIEVSIVLHLTW